MLSDDDVNYYICYARKRIEEKGIKGKMNKSNYLTFYEGNSSNSSGRTIVQTFFHTISSKNKKILSGLEVTYTVFSRKVTNEKLLETLLNVRTRPEQMTISISYF